MSQSEAGQAESNVVDLAARRVANSPHTRGEAFCLDCKHEWVAVAPVGTLWMDCPACGLVRGRYKFRCEWTKPHWTCACGNNLFHITPTYTYCPNCGKEQSWDAHQ